MSVKIVNSSIVFAVDMLMPGLVHPQFLAATGVVPSDWQLDSGKESVFTSYAISKSEYSNKIAFIAEPQKLQVNNFAVDQTVESSLLPELAKKLIKALGEIAVKGIGFNFIATVQMSEPSSYVTETFIKTGPWNSGDFRLVGTAVRLIYGLEPGQMTINIEPGTISVPDEDLTLPPGIVFNANIHADISSVEDCLRILDTYMAKAEQFITIANMLATHNE